MTFEETAAMPEPEKASEPKRTIPRVSEYVVAKAFIDAKTARTLNVGGRLRLTSEQAADWVKAGLISKVKARRK